MAKLSTHVLDTANGIPARNMRITLHALYHTGRTPIISTVTNVDGRTDPPLLDNNAMKKGKYEIHFFVAEYFRHTGNKTTLIPFLDIIPVRFSIADDKRNYHIPLLVSPWSYSTYRGN